MGIVIAVINQKGGVGKTTTTINLGASLSVAERQTLIIDFDPQGNATSGLGLNANDHPTKTVYQALVGQCSMEEVIRPTELPQLFIAPADRNLSGAEVELVNAIAREQKLKTILEPLKQKYHYILIDCPPSLGLLTINALTAADSYLVPMQCEYFALEGLSQLISTAQLIQDALNPRLENEGILLTMFDPRNNLSHQVAEEVKKHFGTKVLKTAIPRNVRLSEAPSHGKPILLYDIESKGAHAYLSVAKEIIENRLPQRQLFQHAQAHHQQPAAAPAPVVEERAEPAPTPRVEATPVAIAAEPAPIIEQPVIPQPRIVTPPPVTPELLSKLEGEDLVSGEPLEAQLQPVATSFEEMTDEELEAATAPTASTPPPQLPASRPELQPGI